MQVTQENHLKRIFRANVIRQATWHFPGQSPKFSCCCVVFVVLLLHLWLIGLLVWPLMDVACSTHSVSYIIKHKLSHLRNGQYFHSLLLWTLPFLQGTVQQQTVRTSFPVFWEGIPMVTIDWKLVKCEEGKMGLIISNINTEVCILLYFHYSFNSFPHQFTMSTVTTQINW